jgi:hypothetical protein
MSPLDLIGILALVAIAGAGGYYAARLFRWSPPKLTRGSVSCRSITQKVSAVGRLVALEVNSKEIATAHKGVAWLPPIILSRAKVAMIFHFEKQYSIDLSQIAPEDVRQIGPGRYRLRLPAIEGRLRLTDAEPYDVQDGRVLGFIEVIPINAERQKELMQEAKAEAAKVLESADRGYESLARASVERQIAGVLEMLGIDVEIQWREAEPVPVAIGEIAPPDRDASFKFPLQRRERRQPEPIAS